LDHLRSILATIQRSLGGLGTTQKLLIASGMVIMLMALFLVSQYAGKSQMMPLSLGSDPDARQQVANYLQASNWQSGRDYQMGTGGTIMVRPEIKYQLAAEMTEGGALPSGSELFFASLFEVQKFTMTKGQLEESSRIALQNELARTLTHFKAIDRATVNLSIPPVKGLGANHTKGKASVTVSTVGDQSLGQTTVDAIARFVAGANARINLTDVEVINASNGKAHKARDPDDQLPADRLAYARSIERAFTNKILELYEGSIKGIRVIVTADVDISRQRIDENRALPKGEGTEAIKRRGTTAETSDTSQSGSAEPGLRSNNTAGISTASSGTGQNSTTEDTEFENTVLAGSRRTQTTDPGGDWTFLAATIGIPRGWIVEQIQREQAAQSPDAEVTEPTAAEIQSWYDAYSLKVVEAVQGHLKFQAKDERIDAEVRTSLLLVDFGEGEAGSIGLSSSGGIWAFGGSSGTMGGIVDKVVLGSLATLAVGMMLMMVRKAGKRAAMPTAEEMIGIPPTLMSDDDVVGEADESETPLTGIEVDDSEVRTRKIMDQVNELVEEDPETAARLIKRWSSVES
jgi:flagellar M-ring protein FliF